MLLEAILAILAGTIFRIRRRHVERAMARAGLANPAQLATQMYMNLARGVSELLRASRGERLEIALDPALTTLFSAARTNGHGLVMACAHTGNWELAGGRMAREIEILAVVKRQSVGAVDRFVERLRTSLGLSLALPNDALRASRAALARRAAVAMMIDQVPARPRDAVIAEFLGADIAVERAPAALALRANVPLVLVGFRRTRGASPELSIHLLARFDPPARTARDFRTWIPDTMRAATARLAQFVRENPADWMWLHRRWRGVPDGKPS